MLFLWMTARRGCGQPLEPSAWSLPDLRSTFFYRFFPDKITWDNAEVVCRRNGGQLVTIGSDEKQDMLKLFLHNTDSMQPFWVGLRQLEPGGDFVWRSKESEETPTADYWQEEIPLASLPLCVVVDPTTDFRWRSWRCDGPETASFVCQMSAPTWASGSEDSSCDLSDLLDPQGLIRFVDATYQSSNASLELQYQCPGDPAPTLSNLSCRQKDFKDVEPQEKPECEEVATETEAVSRQSSTVAVDLPTATQELPDLATGKEAFPTERNGLSTQGWTTSWRPSRSVPPDTSTVSIQSSDVVTSSTVASTIALTTPEQEKTTTLLKRLKRKKNGTTEDVEPDTNVEGAEEVPELEDNLTITNETKADDQQESQNVTFEIWRHISLTNNSSVEEPPKSLVNDILVNDIAKAQGAEDASGMYELMNDTSAPTTEKREYMSTSSPQLLERAVGDDPVGWLVNVASAQKTQSLSSPPPALLETETTVDMLNQTVEVITSELTPMVTTINLTIDSVTNSTVDGVNSSESTSNNTNSANSTMEGASNTTVESVSHSTMDASSNSTVDEAGNIKDVANESEDTRNSTTDGVNTTTYDSSTSLDEAVGDDLVNMTLSEVDSADLTSTSRHSTIAVTTTTATPTTTTTSYAYQNENPNLPNFMAARSSHARRPVTHRSSYSFYSYLMNRLLG